jgi:hypothetical protein
LNIRKKDIRASIGLLSWPFDLPSHAGQRLEVEIVINHHQKLDDFRIQSKSWSYARELQGLRQETGTDLITLPQFE